VLYERVAWASISLLSRVQKNQIFGHNLRRYFFSRQARLAGLTKKPRRQLYNRVALSLHHVASFPKLSLDLTFLHKPVS
jgi:hypothetical protein